MTVAADSMQNLGKDNFDIAMTTVDAFSRGAQTVASEIADYNKASLERGTGLLQDLAGAKNIGQALEIQTNYWKSSYEGFASEMGKLGEIWAGIMQEAMRLNGAPTKRSKSQ